LKRKINLETLANGCSGNQSNLVDFLFTTSGIAAFCQKNILFWIAVSQHMGWPGQVAREIIFETTNKRQKNPKATFC